MLDSMLDLLVAALQIGGFGFLAYGAGLLMSESRTLAAIGEGGFAHRMARRRAAPTGTRAV